MGQRRHRTRLGALAPFVLVAVGGCQVFAGLRERSVGPPSDAGTGGVMDTVSSGGGAIAGGGAVAGSGAVAGGAAIAGAGGGAMSLAAGTGAAPDGGAAGVDAGGSAGSTVNSDTIGTLVACPAAVPTGPCEIEGQACQYAGTACTCANGLWACALCPAEQPASSAPCAMAALDCAYGNVTCQCASADKTWGCGVCPTAAPDPGSACGSAEFDCHYGAVMCRCGGDSSGWACGPAQVSCPTPSSSESFNGCASPAACSYPGGQKCTCADLVGGWNCPCPAAPPIDQSGCIPTSIPEGEDALGFGPCEYPTAECECPLPSDIGSPQVPIPSLWACSSGMCPVTAPEGSNTPCSGNRTCVYGGAQDGGGSVNCSCRSDQWFCK
jgi:hypothetical protein